MHIEQMGKSWHPVGEDFVCNFEVVETFARLPFVFCGLDALLIYFPSLQIIATLVLADQNSQILRNYHVGNIGNTLIQYP